MNYINKIVSKELDNFLIRENTGSVKKVEHKMSDGTIWKSIESNLFQSIEERKHILGYLKGLGLDPFKRGTKEPEKIAIALSTAKWEVVKEAPQYGKSMWD